MQLKQLLKIYGTEGRSNSVPHLILPYYRIDGADDVRPSCVRENFNEERRRH